MRKKKAKSYPEALRALQPFFSSLMLGQVATYALRRGYAIKFEKPVKTGKKAPPSHKRVASKQSSRPRVKNEARAP